MCKHIEEGSLVLVAVEGREERPEEEEERTEILVITTFLFYPLSIGILVYCTLVNPFIRSIAHTGHWTISFEVESE